MSQNIVITGAGRGIGLALCQHFHQRGERVFALCRTPGDELIATGARVIDNVDVRNRADLQTLADRLATPRIDVLINNAGVLHADSLDTLDDEAVDHIRHQFEVNTLGPLNVTQALRGLLGRGSKLAIITSQMGSIADNTSGGYYGYRVSKAAVNMIGRSLALDLAASGVCVGLYHPGFVRTDMTGGQGHIETEQSARGLATLIDQLSLATSGEFRHVNGDSIAW